MLKDGKIVGHTSYLYSYIVTVPEKRGKQGFAGDRLNRSARNGLKNTRVYRPEAYTNRITVLSP